MAATIIPIYKNDIRFSVKLRNLLLILLAASIGLLIGCGKKKSVVPMAGEAKIVATFITPDGAKDVGLLLRIIQKKIVFDSASKTDNISYDTVWGRLVTIPIKDSTGKQIKDSLGNPQFQSLYLKVGNDSVDWHIENKNIDSLIKYK